MPADRTRGSRRNDADGTQLVWTIPVEPMPPTGIAFAENLTPGTFHDPPPPLVDPPPCESILFPAPDDYTSPRRSGHSKKKPENHIPRPPNAFILFRSSFIKSQHVSTEVETNHSTLSKIIGLTWQNLPNEERQIWHAKAKAALDEHKRKFPQYTFRPLHNKLKGGTEKRKVREVGPKDLKRCAKIAQLLVEGKKGAELDAAIQEFDKHHIPEIVTRFETPITARAFRRSSSAPAPDSAPCESFFSCIPSTSMKPRATSSQPSRQPSPAPSPQPRLAHQQDPLPEASCVSIGNQTETLSYADKQEVSFDFNGFSFDNIVAPLPIFECDPLSVSSSAPSPIPPQQQFNCHYIPPPSSADKAASGRGLSIDTSFVVDWARSSSPTSSTDSSLPTTPHYLDSPSPLSENPFSINLDMFDPPPLSKSFNEELLNKTLEAFQESQLSGYSVNNTYPSCDFNSPMFDANKQCSVETQFNTLDFTFSFMAPVPQYSL